ncbi:MAG TPA: hypothetical protein VM308_07455, partial [Sphingomicrobium sp.]|nr:hypothetical protein [Sphingomicrobium sp.]
MFDAMPRPGGAGHSFPFRRLAAALLLAGAAMPAQGATAAGQAPPQEDPRRDIVIYGQPLFRDPAAERELDEQGIESYGVSTIDELLSEVQVELGDPSDQPLILVNGKRINDISEIGALPIETLRSLQVLPRGSAVRLGGTSGQRVINLTLRRETKTVTVTAAPKIATEGEWHAGRGELLFTRVKGDTRANVAFRGRGDSLLLERDRDIIQPEPTLPYALGGNVIAFPTNLANQIDPLLSAAAGQIVTVAPIPAGTPTLANFAAGANQAAVTDLGLYRSLRGRSRNYDFNGTFGTRLAPWLTGTATLRFGRNTGRGLRGLPTGLFVLPATNPASPFSQDVAIAKYGPRPLEYRTRRNNGEANATFNANWGSWIGNLNLKHNRSRDVSLNDRQTTFGAIPLGDSTNPFTTDLGNLILVDTTRIATRNLSTFAGATVTGPAAKLPAGPLQTTIEGSVGWDRLRGRSSVSSLQDRNVRRAQQSIRAAVDVPITSREGEFGSPFGDLSATAELGRTHFSDAGGVTRKAASLTWEPRRLLRLYAGIEEAELPAPLY